MPTSKNLTGTTQQGTGAYGTVPTAANPLSTQEEALTGNIANLGSIYGLGNAVNAFSAQQAALPYTINLPNYQAILSETSGNALQEAQGGITDQEWANLQEKAAERGISTGLSGAGLTNTALLRALGTSTSAQQEKGLRDFSTLMGLTPTGKQFDTNAWLVTPEQQQEAQTYANKLSSSPNPTNAAEAELSAAASGVSHGAGSAAAGITAPKSTTATGTGTTGGGGTGGTSWGSLTPGQQSSIYQSGTVPAGITDVPTQLFEGTGITGAFGNAGTSWEDMFNEEFGTGTGSTSGTGMQWSTIDDLYNQIYGDQTSGTYTGNWGNIDELYNQIFGDSGPADNSGDYLSAEDYYDYGYAGETPDESQWWWENALEG